jgi:hypothetical protein
VLLLVLALALWLFLFATCEQCLTTEGEGEFEGD